MPALRPALFVPLFVSSGLWDLGGSVWGVWGVRNIDNLYLWQDNFTLVNKFKKRKKEWHKPLFLHWSSYKKVTTYLVTTPQHSWGVAGVWWLVLASYCCVVVALIRSRDSTPALTGIRKAPNPQCKTRHNEPYDSGQVHKHVLDRV